MSSVFNNAVYTLNGSILKMPVIGYLGITVLGKPSVLNNSLYVNNPVLLYIRSSTVGSLVQLL